MLRAGGNAIDAIVAMAAALNVVEPYMSGIGGVGLLLFHPAGGETKSLNFTGHAPAEATPERFTPKDQERGPKACVVPGNVAGWLEALQAHGTRSPVEAFQAAIRLAEDGFVLHPANVRIISMSLPRLNSVGRQIYGSLPPRIGGVLRQPELAASLGDIAREGADWFYRGPLGKTIADYVQSQGGLLSLDDLASCRVEWETPLAVNYRGVEVKTCPPNCEGFQILQTLKLLEDEDLKSRLHNSADYIHILSEAMKLATADRIRYGGDPRFDAVPLERLFADEYLDARRKLIRRDHASRSEGERWGGPRDNAAVSPGKLEGLTTHLTAVDSVGNVASITQSLGNAFGNGVVVPGTGIALNNFVFWTEIDPACPTPNLIQPGKRWSCPMAPVHIFRDGQFWFSMATPGSYGILQTTVQMLLNVVEFDHDVQLAIEAPRFRIYEDTRMQIETSVDPGVRKQLSDRGHVLETIDEYSSIVGGGQSVMVDPESGARLAGADPRRDGYALAY